MSEPEAIPDVVTGRFTTPESARAAMVRLEGAGIDGDSIILEGVSPSVSRSDEASQADLEATGDVAKGAGAGATLGAVAGAAAGVVTGVVTGDAGAGAVVGMAGAVGGSVVGGLAGTYAGLPANPQAWETYELDPSDPHPITIAVKAHDAEEAETARAALRGGG